MVSPWIRAEADWASIVWQNDLFTGKDGGGYTNGLFVSVYDLSTEGESNYTPPWFTQPLIWLAQADGPVSFSEQTLGQAMVTPADITKTVPDPNDAPYAGLLFYRASHTDIDGDFADSLSITIGIVGPASMAEQSQKLIHKITGSDQPAGWDYQLDNEPVIMLSRTGVWHFALYDDVIDTVGLLQARAGNLESSVGVGGILRIGSGLAESFATASLSFGRGSTPTAVNGGWYGYAGFEADYVFNYIMVDGNTYRDSQSSDLEHRQMNFTAGFSYSWHNISATLSYKSGTSLDKLNTAKDSYGAFSVAWRL